MRELIRALACSICKALGGQEVQEAQDETLPTLKPCGTISIYLASSILLDKLEGMGREDTEIYLPDMRIKIYKLEEVENSYELEKVSRLEYIPEGFDCDNFAAKLFGKFAGLVWTNIHALNWFIDENESFWWIEPQTKKLSRVLETWQGYRIRFLLGR